MSKAFRRLAVGLVATSIAGVAPVHAYPCPTAMQTGVIQAADTIIRIAEAPRFPGVGALEEQLSIGVLDGPEELLFGEVFDIAVSDDGWIFVLDRSIPAVRVYDQSGSFIRTIGRGGEGPGEIGNPSGMRVLSDGRLAIYDTRNRRINLCSRAGDRLTEWPIPPTGPTIAHRFGFAADTAGFVYAKTSVIRTPAGDLALDPSRGPRTYWLRMRTTDGSVVDSVAEPDWPPIPEPFRAENSRGWRQMAMPFRPRSLFVISPMGYAVSGVPSRYAFEILRPGQPTLSVRRDVPPAPVRAVERDRQRSRIQNAMREVDPRWTWGGRDIPAVKPLYLDLAIGLDGRIWLTREMSEPPARARIPAGRPGGGAATGAAAGVDGQDYVPSPTLFEVFEPDGAFIGALEAPPGVTLFVTRGDQAWGVARDDSDVEFVRRYRIVWR